MVQLMGRITQLTLESGKPCPPGDSRTPIAVSVVAAFNQDGREITVTCMWPRGKDTPSIGQLVALTLTPDID